MCDESKSGCWEADDGSQFSVMENRVRSFHDSSLAHIVPPERMARAGFFFTGKADCVRCFSCQKTVQNWRSGDTPVDRHKQVSPTCQFLTCVHRENVARSPVNGSAYNENAEDMAYRLATKQVVDETPYPMHPDLKKEEDRLETFSLWPHTSPMNPTDLAEAGFFYLGESDKVQCFCCGGVLRDWEAGDDAWYEHSKHHSNCFFILGHDVGNIPLDVTVDRSPTGNLCFATNTVEGRLQSFANVQLPVDHESLARAGFYYIGNGDSVKCFSCDQGLNGWEPTDDPWEEHAKFSPGCSFLLEEKGQGFVNRIQLGRGAELQNGSSQQTGISDVLQSEIAQKALKMGFDPSLVEKAIMEKKKGTSSGYTTADELVNDLLCCPDDKQDVDPIEKLKELQREKQCKICMDRDVCVVFLPCGHLVSCLDCAKALTKCPICCGPITQKIKTYIA